MSRTHPLKEIVKFQKKGIPAGIYSACSANDIVLEACMERAMQDSFYVLIEATANQVNQYGGYTGMKPQDFKSFVLSIAKRVNFPADKIILGGDHLGPLTWQSLPAKEAMEEAKELIRQFVLAGFTKIHIDTSMHLGDDDRSKKLEKTVIARRGAILAKAAEEAYKELVASNPDALHPVYVIGSEVPIPGGSQGEEDELQVTTVNDFSETVDLFKEAFLSNDLSEAWDNVIAIVVQPGVEFGDESIHEYDRNAAKELCEELKNYPTLVFEGHSTDYQTPEALKAMVEDGIAILKVGPALIFALREALFALNHIENELFQHRSDVQLSRFIEVLDEAMVKNPANWIKHYHGSQEKIRLARKYSFSDRCRYYFPVPEVKEAISRLMQNLKSTDIPISLISQYMPVQYYRIRKGLLSKEPESLAKDRVKNCIDQYLYATQPVNKNEHERN
ncbi:MAG: class II D-tagatose-bisphosphate aldolase, non-catalytic subunit [Clostridiaceae bacterium]|nr:class II D-tagatose-bisphosphate aldolase, non-catalytic subunit [Clostridiaceae bacterium]